MTRFAVRSVRRWACLAGVLVLGAGLWTTPQSVGRAAAKQAATEEAEDRTVQTKDGVSIHFTYYKSDKGKNASVIVLLHMKDGNRFVWQDLAKRLQSFGHAVIAVDLRGHGESKLGDALADVNANQDGGKKKGGKKAGGADLKPADYAAMADQDLEAIKKFIFEEHQAERLNMNKLGIVGPEMGASVAAAFAALDWAKEPYPDGQPGFQTPRGQDVRAIVLISPQSSFHGMAMSKAITFLRDPRFNIALLVSWAKSDPKDKGQARKVYDMAKAPPLNEKRMYEHECAGKLQGTNLLGKRLGVEEQILAFFDKHLTKLESDWRDRRSKLEKKAG